MNEGHKKLGPEARHGKQELPRPLSQWPDGPYYPRVVLCSRPDSVEEWHATVEWANRPGVLGSGFRASTPMLAIAGLMAHNAEEAARERTRQADTARIERRIRTLEDALSQERRTTQALRDKAKGLAIDNQALRDSNFSLRVGALNDEINQVGWLIGREADESLLDAARRVMDELEQARRSLARLRARLDEAGDHAPVAIRRRRLRNDVGDQVGLGAPQRMVSLDGRWYPVDIIKAMIGLSDDDITT